jgi:hypothetical protein
MTQILGGGITPDCGGTANFPPRNEPLAFRSELEVTYRDRLRRGTSQTFVDPEGDIVWTQEYLRYRVGGCSHPIAQGYVFNQIAGSGIAPVCTPVAPTPPPAPTPAPPAPSGFSRSGTGDNVFDIPRSVTRIGITGSYDGFCQNFIVWITTGGSRRLFVNEILGTCSSAVGRRFDGTYLLSAGGGTVEIRNSSGVVWEFFQR